MKTKIPSYIRDFDTIRLEDIDLVGGKNASLGELYQSVRKTGIRIPKGFVITVEAYAQFLLKNRLRPLLDDLFYPGKQFNLEEIKKMGARIREAFLSSKLPEGVSVDVIDAYRKLTLERKGRLDVAVRSSSTAEDLPTASFAGQQDTFLNVEGERELLESVVKCFSSLYTDRAISYRNTRQFNQCKVGISVGVQEMVRSDLAASGVVFTLDPESGFRDVVLINSAYGLGESVVKGEINPDEFIVYKRTLQEGFVPILKREVGSKEHSLVYDPISKGKVIQIQVEEEDRKRLSLNDAEVLELARAGVAIEAHFSMKRERPSPMDIEWAKDGLSGDIYIVQARPETVQSQRLSTEVEREYRYSIIEAGPVLVRGRSVGSSVKAGIARVIENIANLNELKDYEILVTQKTDPDWEPVLKRASAVVTNRGGRTCHAAIVARELGIPAVVGTGNATQMIKTGQWITVSTAEGDEGLVYQGAARFRTDEIPQRNIENIKTKVLLNLGRSEESFRMCRIPNSGVGLARMEFMISASIRIHPMALIHFDQVKEPETRRKILDLTFGYRSKEDYFTQKLSEQIGQMAAAFYPKSVILRLSDFKSNEYSNLIGGSSFETYEENPMIGFRGAFRYSHPLYKEGFRLECEAVKKVRFEMGLTNLNLMIPFVRTIEDSRNALAELRMNGIQRGDGGLEIWMMCEVPSNVILARDFLRDYDGFSIGSNDLTQLILGVDRDSEILSPLFNESDPSVKQMMSRVIQDARAMGKPIGICGQAPSDNPQFAEFLVAEGITSISLNPDSVLKTLPVIEAAENRRYRS